MLSNSLRFKSYFEFTEMRTLFFATPESTSVLHQTEERTASEKKPAPHQTENRTAMSTKRTVLSQFLLTFHFVISSKLRGRE